MIQIARRRMMSKHTIHKIIPIVTINNRQIIYNGGVAGTNIGYLSGNFSYIMKIYNIESYIGCVLQIEGARSTWGYRYIFCKNYELLPQNQSEYESNPALWTDNMITAASGRGSSGGFSMSVTVPAGAVHLILLESSTYPASVQVK